jgi:hypothetical protein
VHTQKSLRIVVLAAIGFGLPLMALGDGPASPRVRATDDGSIAALLREAPSSQSPTFRRLVETINESDGIVYVQPGRCGHHVRVCLALSVTAAGRNRVLRIIVNMHRDHDELVAAIGHELQHAIEALSDPHVTNDLKMYAFFNRIGPTSEERFETGAAIQVGLDVLTEVRAHSKTKAKD